jgi:hypothetical protein
MRKYCFPKSRENNGGRRFQTLRRARADERPIPDTFQDS